MVRAAKRVDVTHTRPIGRRLNLTRLDLEGRYMHVKQGGLVTLFATDIRYTQLSLTPMTHYISHFNVPF